MPVQAHINVLGWVSLSIFGLVYKSWSIETGKLALVQFGLFNAGIIVQAVAVTMILKGEEGMGPLAGIGSGLLIAGMALFAIIIYRAARA